MHYTSLTQEDLWCTLENRFHECTNMLSKVALGGKILISINKKTKFDIFRCFVIYIVGDVIYNQQFYHQAVQCGRLRCHPRNETITKLLENL